MIELKTIKSNPNNPRVIKDDKFKKLVKSIKEFPKMMELRPMVINNDNIVLGGNMRLKALKELGYKSIPSEWVKSADQLTEEEQRRFIIADNVGFGEHDWEMLQAGWDLEELEDWGLEVPGFESEPLEEDYSGKNQELDIDSMDGDMVIKLKYTEEEYHTVRAQLAKIADTPEQAVWKLLGNE